MTGRLWPRSPSAVLDLSPADADALLDRLEGEVPVRPPYLELPSQPGGVAFVFGDSHGDWKSTTEVVRAFEQAGPTGFLLGLGDYVDRCPADCPHGSVANALYLLMVAAQHPDRVALLQGNHETVRRIGAFPHDLPEEVGSLWGPSGSRYDRLMGLLERGPLAASAAGAYFAHAGFPIRGCPARWTDAFPPRDDAALSEIVWAECDASSVRRGAAPAWDERDLERFLRASGLSTVWRGHDPDLTGRPLYHGRAMTLHTTRYYEEYGGVLYAEVPLDRRLASVTAAPLRRIGARAG
jgi:hypothetical protein